MNCFRINSNLAGLAALIGTIFFATCPVRAQEPATAEIEAELVQVLADQPDLRSRLLSVDLTNPADELLGATLQPVGDTLRAQLDIPAGQGLLVTNLRADGLSAQAGLKQNDILLSLADKPLATAEDLTNQLKAAGESPVSLKILRTGKPTTIQVRPIYRVTLGPIHKQRAEYYIGVSVNRPEDAVRAQLGLSESQGVVVTEVIGGSPAERAGIKVHDVILDLNGKPIDKPETLAHQVQVAKDREIILNLLHAGKPVTVSLTAAVRKVETTRTPEAVRLWLARQSNVALSGQLVRYYNLLPHSDLYRVPRPEVDADDLRQRLDQVEKELNAVRAALDKINETLKAHKGTKRD